MRTLLLALLLCPSALFALDAERFAQAIGRNNTSAVDRWIMRELLRNNPSMSANTNSTPPFFARHDSLVEFLRRQPGVKDASWDKCMAKLLLWPGHSRIGLRFEQNGVVCERCYLVQEGKPDVIKLFGWRPHMRKDRYDLVFRGTQGCPGFVEEQRRL